MADSQPIRGARARQSYSTNKPELKVLQCVAGGHWEIDREGRIWRLGRRNNRGGVVPCGRRRAEAPAGQGYLQVRAMIDGTRHYAYAHRLVWTYFRGEIPDGMTINHRDGMRDNNHPDNLECVSLADNHKHAITVLKRPIRRGAEHSRAKLTEADVRKIRALHAGRVMGVPSLARTFGVSRWSISNILCRKSWANVE